METGSASRTFHVLLTGPPGKAQKGTLEDDLNQIREKEKLRKIFLKISYFKNRTLYTLEILLLIKKLLSGNLDILEILFGYLNIIKLY